jgi:hypothetical protein
MSVTETYKNAKLVLGTSIADVYTCPAATTAIVLQAQAANVDGANAVTVTAGWTDASDSATLTELEKVASVAAGAALGLLSGPLVLEAGDKFRALCSSANGIKVTLSILERS